jgi:BMFP domain-containing protein YqiC
MRRSNFISDIAKMANGAATALGGAREEIDNMIRQRMERALNARGLVTREEFDAMRTRHEALAARVAVLEAGPAAGESPRAKTKESPARKAAKRLPRRKRRGPPEKNQPPDCLFPPPKLHPAIVQLVSNWCQIGVKLAVLCGFGLLETKKPQHHVVCG